MRRRLAILLSCLIVFIVSGCARKIVLHPVTDADIRMDGNWVCMTPEYIQEVMKARLGK